ncbi:hypothetical protein L204_103354 [Cryptococcus depauperatus]|nr:hypothetical protein L204_01671 [Cryptococcus depauperatus CBS 7855]
MSAYIPIHARGPYRSSLSKASQEYQSLSPRYASPDTDPDIPYHRLNQAAMSAQNDKDAHGGQHKEPYAAIPGHQPRQWAEDDLESGGPSRKRARVSSDQSEAESRRAYNGHEPVSSQHIHPNQSLSLTGSAFNISPRNPFTSVVGEFIMNSTVGLENVEIEVKIGQLIALTESGQPPRRIHMPSLSEMILPHDFPVGPFVATLERSHHKSLNDLLNRATESQMKLSSNAGRLEFSRHRLTDSFYDTGGHGGKVRVSRNTKTGEVVACIRKKRIADMNVFCPGMPYDLRISVSVEEPCNIPSSSPKGTRIKDRASYRHQICQVDLTSVYMPSAKDPTKQDLTCEIEIEVLDVPALLAEGRAESDRFDEILQNLLDTARMLIKNV